MSKTISVSWLSLMHSTAFIRIALNKAMAECGLENEHQKQEDVRSKGAVYPTSENQDVNSDRLVPNI